MTETLKSRFNALPAAGIEDDLHLEQGRARDYQALCEHHYRAARPATIMRVLVLKHHQPTVSGRFLHRADQSQTVGVLIESLPALSCRLREAAIPNRYTHWPMAQRARILNRELRCISRVVVHPQWRGLGLAVRLVRAALDQPQTIFTEALAAMGKVHPFFERAGMAAYHRPPHAFDDRLVAALQHCGLDPTDLAILHQTLARIDNMDEPQRQWLLTELARWCRRSFNHATDLKQQLRAARQRLLCEPVYFLKHHGKSAGNTPPDGPPPR